MRKYKFFKFNGYIYKGWIYLIPAIEISLNDMVYSRYNFSIMLHFLWFHCRWLFLKEE